MLIQTEYEFNLPKGYVDEEGTVHRSGIMRLATALDEIETARDPRVKSNPGYAPAVLLSRVVTGFGSLKEITPAVMEKLFAADFSFLQNMYETINRMEDPQIQVECPHCGKVFRDTINFMIRE